jgi:hypothetical protein
MISGQSPFKKKRRIHHEGIRRFRLFKMDGLLSFFVHFFFQGGKFFDIAKCCFFHYGH